MLRVLESQPGGWDTEAVRNREVENFPVAIEIIFKISCYTLNRKKNKEGTALLS